MAKPNIAKLDTILRRLLPALLAAVLIAALCGCGSPEKTEEDKLKVSVIDVGKGDCMLVQFKGLSILIDTGYQATAESVKSYLESSGVKAIDILIITHYHKDHVGGAADIIKSFDVDHIYLPNYEGSSAYYEAFMAALAEKGAVIDGASVSPPYVFHVKEDMEIKFGAGGDEAKLTIFASGIEFDEGEGNHNDCSLVTFLTYGEDSYLFAGDIEKKGINSFLEAHPDIKTDVLKVPHHGNKKPGMEKFLKAVAPKIALITDSDDDQALDSNLKVLEELGAEIWRTSVKGTIVVESSGKRDYKVSGGL